MPLPDQRRNRAGLVSGDNRKFSTTDAGGLQFAFVGTQYAMALSRVNRSI